MTTTTELRALLAAATPAIPLRVDNVPGAGWEIRALLPEGFTFEGTCHNADGKTWFQVWRMASPAMVLVATERWVQFETDEWEKLQAGLAPLIVAAVNSLPGLLDEIEKLQAAGSQIWFVAASQRDGATPDIQKAQEDKIFHSPEDADQYRRDLENSSLRGVKFAVFSAVVNGSFGERAALISKLRSHCNSASSPGVHAFAKELLRDMGEE